MDKQRRPKLARGEGRDEDLDKMAVMLLEQAKDFQKDSGTEVVDGKEVFLRELYKIEARRDNKKHILTVDNEELMEIMLALAVRNRLKRKLEKKIKEETKNNGLFYIELK